MIERMITSNTVIAKVIADLDIEENDIKITDIKSWIAEAVSKIGSINLLDHKVLILLLKDYLCKLPCDLNKLLFVAYSNCKDSGWIPMKKSTGVFSVFDRKKELNCCNMLIQDEGLLPLVKNLFEYTSDRLALDKLNEDTNIRQTLSSLINEYTVCNKGNNIFCNRVTYDIKPGYLISNVPNGFIKISYLAEYTDEDGMPMIPDKSSYAEAIYWYVAMKLLYIEYYTGRKPLHIYYDAKRSWNFYRQQAYAECLMPNENELDNIKNTWHTLAPEINEIDTFYSSLGEAQHIYNANRTWR